MGRACVGKRPLRVASVTAAVPPLALPQLSRVQYGQIKKIKVVVFVLLSLSVCANGHSDVLLENPHNRNSQVIILMYSLFTGVLSIKLIFLYVYLAGEPAGAFNLLSRPGPRTVPELT